MRVVTNPGSNLTPEEIERYDVVITPQQIVVDDEEHDTRRPIPLAQVDDWVRGAKVHPYVVGTTAAQYVAAFQDIAKTDREILAVQTSRKIIKSYDAALSAAKTLSSLAGYADLRVVVADSGVTDVGAGLATLLACRARAEGRALDEIGALLEAYRACARTAVTVKTLDYLVKGGRATALRAWFADLFDLKPIIAFDDGELSVAGKMKGREHPSGPLCRWLAEQVGEGAAIWLAVAHGDDHTLGRECADAIAERFDVRYVTVRPISASIYLHGGRGSILLAAVPLDELPFVPSAQPE